MRRSNATTRHCSATVATAGTREEVMLFFIDKGFGTPDTDSVTFVSTALRSLHPNQLAGVSFSQGDGSSI